MSNYTQTINIPSSDIKYNAPKTGWNNNHYNQHYKDKVEPIFKEIEKAVNQISKSQEGDFHTTINILWNKCRYFELTLPSDKEIQRFIKQSAKIKSPSYAPNMLVGGRLKLEAIVKAFNKKGIYCNITQDWI